MSLNDITSDDPSTKCEVQFPSSSSSNVPVPSGADGLLSWDNSIPAYVNTGINPFQVNVVIGRVFTLTGMNVPVQISTLLFGSYRVLISPPLSNQATADFSISKSDSSSNDALVTVHTAFASAGGTNLSVKWPAGLGIQIQKDSILDNGDYTVSVVGL